MSKHKLQIKGEAVMAAFCRWCINDDGGRARHAVVTDRGSRAWECVDIPLCRSDAARLIAAQGIGTVRPLVRDPSRLKLRAAREVIFCAMELCENTANENPPEVEQEDWDKLSAAIDALKAAMDTNPNAGPVHVRHAITDVLVELGDPDPESDTVLNFAD